MPYQTSNPAVHAMALAYSSGDFTEQYGRQSYMSSRTLSPRKPIKRTVCLPQKGDAKAVMLRVRIAPEDHKAIEVAAKNGKQPVSEWIRGTLNAALQG